MCRKAAVRNISWIKTSRQSKLGPLFNPATAMPLSPLAEAILQPVIEALLQIAGYFTARLLVPLVTFGWVHVEPGPSKRLVRPGLGRVRRSPEARWIMDAELGALVGLLFWLALGVAVFLLQPN